MSALRYAVYRFQPLDRWPRRLLFAALVLSAGLLTRRTPTTVRVPVTALVLAAAVVACYGIGRRMAGCDDDSPHSVMNLIGAAVAVAALLAIAPVLYRPLVLMAPLVTVLLLDGILVASARLRPSVRQRRGAWVGIAIAAATVAAVVAIPRVAGSGGGLTYPTPASASLAFEGVAAGRAAPLPTGTVHISVAYTPLSPAAAQPRATFDGRRVYPVKTAWTHGTLLLTYRVTAARPSCLLPFVATAPPGSPGPQFAADPSRAPLRISLWVGGRRSITVCGGAGRSG